MTSTEQPAGTQNASAGTEARAAQAPASEVASDDMARDDVARPVDGAPAGRVDEWEDRWRRAAADLENLRKRYARDAERDRAAERARTAAAWLPVLDHLELALAHADADPRSIVAGVQAVRDQAVAVLDRLGYPRHDEVGVPFDPAMHDVLRVVDDPEIPPGTVVAVVRPGYGDAGRQLRPAGVAVSQPPADAPGGTGGRQGHSGVPGSPGGREPGPGEPEPEPEPGPGRHGASGHAE